MGGRTAIRFATMTVLVGSWIIGVFSTGATAKTRTPALERFAADTIYHVVVSPADSAFHISYGPIPLVSCVWQLTASMSEIDWSGVSADGDGGWSTVNSRHAWSGRAGVPDRVVRIVARTVTADPELVERIMPERFEVSLSSDAVLRVMTANGAKQQRTFGERWRGWCTKWLSSGGSRVIELLVTPQDAQTLYYAFEPGTPVVVDSREP